MKKIFCVVLCLVMFVCVSTVFAETSSIQTFYEKTLSGTWRLWGVFGNRNGDFLRACPQELTLPSGDNQKMYTFYSGDDAYFWLYANISMDTKFAGRLLLSADGTSMMLYLEDGQAALYRKR